MKAICVTPSRTLELHDIAAPTEAAPGHILIDMEASAINHGDKTFLNSPLVTGGFIPGSAHDVWGASGAGRVVAIGAGVPAAYAGRKVAAYRSLACSPATIGLWAERAQMHHTCCLILPDSVSAADYSGSLVNIITAHGFLQEVAAEGHAGVIVTAPGSATGLAIAALARRAGVPAILLARSPATAQRLRAGGNADVIDLSADTALAELTHRATALGATAVFDGAGGETLTRIIPALPVNTTIWAYGFLNGTQPVSFPTAVLMMRNLTIRRFSNFESRTAKNPEALAAALAFLSTIADDPAFHTRIGQTFRYDQINEAMAYESAPGAKALLVP